MAHKKRKTEKKTRAVRRHMRRFADVTTNRIIMGAMTDARKGSCAKAVRSLRLVRDMDYDPAYMALAVKNLDRYCSDELEAQEALSRGVREEFPGSAELQAMNPLTAERLKMTARELEALNLTRTKNEAEAQRERLRGTFKVRTDKVDPITGAFEQRRVNLSARNIEKYLREGRISREDAKALTDDLNKLNAMQNLKAGFNRSTIDVEPAAIVGPLGKEGRRYREGWAKVLRLRGSAQTRLPQIGAELRKQARRLKQQTLSPKQLEKLLPQIQAMVATGQDVPPEVVQILTEVATGKMLERKWNPKTGQWRAVTPHGKGGGRHSPALPSESTTVELPPGYRRGQLVELFTTARAPKRQIPPPQPLYKKPYPRKVRPFKPGILMPLPGRTNLRRGVRNRKPLGWWWW